MENETNGKRGEKAREEGEATDGNKERKVKGKNGIRKEKESV